MAKKKTKAFTQKELDHYKELLLEKMKEILEDMGLMEESVFQGGGELSTMPVHLADVGTDSYEQEFSLGLMAEERKILAEIHKALARIQNGTFGMCEGLGTPIEENRLEAIPWTRYSLEYARMLESGAARADSFRHRPIDIQRDSDEYDEDEEENEDEMEEIDADDMELLGSDSDDDDEDEDEDEDGAENGSDKPSDKESLESLDDLQEDEDYDEDEDIDRQRNSA